MIPMQDFPYISTLWVERQIGCGSYGEVYLCHSYLGNHQYAAKVAHFGADFRRRWLAENESEVLLELSEVPHKHVVHLYTIIREPKQTILLLEYVSDITFTDGLLQWPLFTEQDLMLVMKQLLSALQYCHDRRIVHRDVRPENILWTHLPCERQDYPTLKLIDFNLARKIPDDRKFLQVRSQGDTKYMSPECLKEPSVITFTCDVWSTGVLLFTLLAGYPPFFDYNYDHLVLNIVEGNFSLPQKFWSHVGEGKKDFLKKMLHIDYKERWSVNELLQHDWLIHTRHESCAPWPAHARLREFCTYLKKLKTREDHGKFILTSKQPRTSFVPSPQMIPSIT